MDLAYFFSYWRQWIFWGLCLIALIQIFYYLYLFLRLAHYVPKTKTASVIHPVSVVICARDAANSLEKYLPEVLTQDFPYSHEVVVVNDNSRDDTKYFLEAMEKAFRQMKPLTLTQEAMHIPGKKFPLSMGIKASKYEVLLLTDADCVPASNQWMSIMQDAYSPGIEVVLGYGAFHKKNGLLNKLVRFETFHTAIQYFSYALAGMPYMGVGRNLSYLKDVFYRNKGFTSINHIPGGDDDLFINKVGTKTNTAIVVDPNAFTFSDAPENYGQWWKQKSRHYTTARFYKPFYKSLLGLYSLSHFLFYPLVVATAIVYDWQLALSIFAVRLFVQGYVFYKCMYKLNEKDLFPFFWLLDIWQFFYYIIFSITLFKKPKSTWR